MLKKTRPTGLLKKKCPHCLYNIPFAFFDRKATVPKFEGDHWPFGLCRWCRNKKNPRYMKSDPEKLEKIRKSIRTGHRYPQATHVEKLPGMRSAELVLLRNRTTMCQICKSIPVTGKIQLDHCHGTGLIRGLLCSNCNGAIGMLNNDPSILKSAIDYLKNPPLYNLAIPYRRVRNDYRALKTINQDFIEDKCRPEIRKAVELCAEFEAKVLAESLSRAEVL